MSIRLLMAQMKTLGPVRALKTMKIFDPGRIKGNKGGSRRDFGRRASHNSEDFSGSESDGENLRFRRDKGSKTGFDRRRNVSKGRGGFDVYENSGFKSRGTMRDRKSTLKDKFDRSSQGPRHHDTGFRGDDYDGRRKGAGGGNLRNFKSPKRENFGNRERGRGQNFDNRSTGNGYLDDERHRRPRENVR